MQPLQPGQMLGPYRILSQIGQGGMAIVYKAFHAAMDRNVAVKVLSSDMAQNEQLKGRFQQEARLIANLEHAHILPVYDYGEDASLYYIVMRYLEAGTLKERIEKDSLSLAEIDLIFTQLADALGYAHERGVLHRDVKPSNALVDRLGNVFLTDFGIAKLLEGSVQYTVTGTITGTPAYMSPEQAQGETLDPRSDIYSLGIILYEMVTGRVPFEAETPLAVILKHLHARLPLPTTIRPDVHPAIERLLLKALSKDRNERFATCQEFLAAWKQAYAEASRTGVAAAPEVQAAPAIPTPVPAPPGEKARTTQASTVIDAPSAPIPAASARPRLGLWIGIGAGVALLALVAIAAVLVGLRLLSASDETARTPATTSLSSGSQSEPGESAVSNSSETAFTSWTGGNTISKLQIHGDQVYTLGPGGITIWNRSDGSILRRVTTADGLPSPWVQALYMESESLLWIGTDAGLVRQDGDRQVLYTIDDGLDSDYITALLRLGDGRLLVGTEYSDQDGGGLNVFDGSRWSAMPGFPSTHPDNVSEGQVANAITAFLEDGSTLWVGTWGGLARYENESWTVFNTGDGLPGNGVLTIVQDTQGRLLLGTDGGAAWFDGVSFTVAEQGPPDGVFGIVESPQDVYWLSGGGGVWRYDAPSADWRLFNAESGDLSFWGVNGAQADADGNVYFGTENNGLLRFSSDLSITYWKIPNIPRSGAFGGILTAPDGKLLFLASSASDVDVFDPAQDAWEPSEQDWRGFPIYIDPASRVWENEWPSGVWILTPDGQETHITDRQGLPAEAFVNDVVVAADGTAWLATSQGLAHFDGTQIVELIGGEPMGLPEDEVRRVFITSDGTLWVTNGYEFARRVSGGEWETLGYQNPFRDEGVWVYDLAEDANGEIWLGTSSGAYHFTGGKWSLVTYGDPNVELPSAVIRCITIAPDGNIWFGTDRGAARFDGSAWQTFQAGPGGLIHKEVNDILVTASGEVFFATSGGVTRLQP